MDVSAELASMEVFLKRVLPGTIELTTRVEPDVGICPMSPSRLQQVVLNLALNARDAMPDGGTLEVELTPATDPAELKKQRLDPQQSYARLHIADTGTGMDRRTRARLFEPLFTTKGPEKGTGLGMAVTLQIVRDVQGAIEVDSQPGEGTRFTVYLPVQR